VPDFTTGITGWLKNSFIDFPGTVSTVLFFSGCNLRCPYCHNPQIVTNAFLPQIPLQEILDFFQNRKGLINGVVLSGGEPTMHETAKSISAHARSMEYTVKLDTNGLLPEKIKEIAPNYLALDIKTIPENYALMLKAPYNNIKERLQKSIDIVKSMKENAEIRITIAPEIINIKIIEEITPMLEGVEKVYLQPMHSNVELLNPKMQEMNKIPMDEIEIYKKILEKISIKCEIRGYAK
jgi:pyruvate formate lyase activating enzyme